MLVSVGVNSEGPAVTILFYHRFRLRILGFCSLGDGMMSRPRPTFDFAYWAEHVDEAPRHESKSRGGAVLPRTQILEPAMISI